MEKICSFFLFRQLADLINNSGAGLNHDLPDAIAFELERQAERESEDQEANAG